ncbi:MAG: metallophosphoesterase, partial [Nitrososphaerota archaeon]
MARIIENVPALLLTKPVRTIVVADLHLGFEEELRIAGVRIPPQSPRVVEALAELCVRERARRLVVLGDLKHQFVGASQLERKILPKLVSRLREGVGEVMVIPGNHDGDLDEILGDLVTMLPVRGWYIAEERVGLTHGHVKPDKQLLRARLLVVGHLHPVLRLGYGEASSRFRVWLMMRGERRVLCNRLLDNDCGRMGGVIQLLIMPSFNMMLTGRSVTDLD